MEDFSGLSTTTDILHHSQRWNIRTIFVIMYGHTSTNCKVGEAGFDLFAQSREHVMLFRQYKPLLQACDGMLEMSSTGNYKL